MAAKKKPAPLFKTSPNTEDVEDTNTRVYYRHVTTGDRGYVVNEDGQTRIRLDRVGDPYTRRLDGNWEPEHEHRPLLRHQWWMVAFEADKLLCRAIGLHSLATRDWLNMSNEKRIEWGEHGPRQNRLRKNLWLAIKVALEKDSE